MEINQLLINLYDKKTIIAIEQLAITKFNMSEQQLAEKDVAASIEQLTINFPNAKQIAIFCGTGNNANDGKLMAKQLQSMGKQVQIITADVWHEKSTVTADVIIDAIFGLGINRKISGVWIKIIKQINSSWSCPLKTIPLLFLIMPHKFSRRQHF
jgi:NAD(P)H-hydrate epimerase